MTAPVELDSPPADPVEWEVRHYMPENPGWFEAEWVTARTAFDAWRIACAQFENSPPFGSCRVTRAAVSE